MLRSNTFRCLLATYVAFSRPLFASDPPAHAPTAAPTPPEPANAPPETEKPSPRLGAPQSDGPREPDVSSCVNGYLTAREWLDAMSPPSIDDDGSAVSLPGVRGVAMILRFEGRVIGEGEDWPLTVGDDRMLRRAMGRAIASALGSELLRNVDAVAREETGKRLSLEIDFAGKPEPLLGRTIDECVTRLDRGLDGIAVRRGYPGSISWHVAFPATLVANNTARAPRAVIDRLVHDAGLPLKDLPELVQIEPVGIFRFASLRLAQSAPDAPPLPRGRGITRVVDAEITKESVAAHAMGILRRFARALPPEEGNEAMPRGIGIFGTYSPVRDTYEPLIAPPQDQAFVAWAAAAVATSSMFSDEERFEARALADRVLRDFVETTPTESRPLDTVPAMAGIVCAIELLVQSPDPNGEGIAADLVETGRLAREKLTERLVRGNNVNERALASLAAAMTVGTERRMVLATELRKVLDALWRLPNREQVLSIFPWLVLADSHYARATGEGTVHSTEALNFVRLLFLVQAGFAELGGEADLRGGFRLSGERRAGVTSQSLRPGLAIAGMLSYSGFVPTYTAEGVQTVMLMRQRLIALLRFVQELTVSGDLPKFYRNPKRVEGGVREALWDSEQTVPANALAVLLDVTALQAELWSAPPALRPEEAPVGTPSERSESADTAPTDHHQEPPSE